MTESIYRGQLDATKMECQCTKPPKYTIYQNQHLQTELEVQWTYGATIGFETIFSAADEKKLVEHVTYMANIGYGYNKISIQYLAKEFAESLGRNVKSQSSLSNCWFYGFLKH